MNVLVIAAENETGQRLACAAEAAGFAAQRGGHESPLRPGTDILVLDGFDGGDLGGHVRRLLAGASPRPYVLAGVAPEADALDEGLAAGIDEFYPAGYERSLVFRVTLHDRRENAARLNRAVDQRIEQANDVIYTVDFAGTFTSANAAAERLTGYRREQLIGMNMSELLLPGYLEICQAAIRAKLAGDEDSSFFEVQIRHADGDARWVEISSQLLTEGGRPVAVQGIARDLSRRRELDREIVFRAELLENMPTPAFAVDLTGTVLFWNRAATELFQITAEAAARTAVLDLIMSEELAQLTRDSLSADGGPGTHSNELTLRRADGTEFVAQVASSPLEDSEGRAFGAIAICIDLTGQRRQEEQIRLMATIVESAAIAAFTRSLDGTVTSWNPAAERMFGWTAEEVVGAKLTAMVPDTELARLGGQFAHILSGGRMDEETIRLHKDGSEIPVRLTSDPLRDRTGAIVGTATLLYDLSERKASESELGDTRAQLRAIFESTSEAVLVFDSDLRLLTANRAGLAGARAIFGSAPAKGDDLRAWVLDRDWANFQANAARALRGDRVQVEWPMPTLDGGESWFDYTFNPVRDENGRIYAVAMMARDVTLARQMESALAEREAALTAVFQSMNESLVLMDLELRFILGNPLAHARTKMFTGNEPLPGHSMEEYVRPEHWRGLKHFHRRAMHGERPSVELNLLDAGGASSWWEYSYLPVKDAAGEIAAVAMVTRDITDRKLAEAALQEATEHHRTVVENTADALFVLEVEGPAGGRRFRVGMVNSAFERLTGLRGEEIAGKDVGQVLPGPSWLAARERYLEAIAARATISYEEVVPHSSSPHVQTRLTPIFDGEDRCVRIVGASRDITEQVRLEAEERAARANADRLALIVESANDAILGLDMEHRIVSWSPGAERVYGYTAEEALGQPINLIYVEDEATVNHALERLSHVYEGRTYANSPTVRRHKSGRRLDVMVSAFPLRDSDGNIVGVGSTATDVTDQRRAEAALSAMAADLKAVFASTREQLVFLDAEAYVVSVNAAAVESMLRVWGREILPGEDMRRWMDPADVDRFEENIARALAGETVEFERSATVNGATYAFEISYSPIRMADGAIRGVLLGSRDVTERKRTSEALLQTQKLESLAVLAGGIAHDFNNLLVGILGNAGLALGEVGPNSPARETIEAIETAGQRAAELARQMLAYSGKGRFLIQDVDVSALVEEMTHLLRVSIGKRTRLQLHLGESLPAVQGDATQLRQVVMNLVINASDAIGDADGVISVSTALVDASSEELASAHLSPDLPAGRYVAVEVSDTGAGMEAETLARIFDPFFTTKFTGRGLGLAAALGIMRGHRGAIKVSSAPGEGTTFRLLLPAAGADAEARITVVDADDWRGSGLVLVVDDEPTVRAVTARALKAFGFEVLEAIDGAEGVELFRERSADVACVLLDMTMPRMNGDEAFVEIKRINPEARVVLMSGFSEQDAIERFSGRGLAGFIQKPYELSELRSMLRSAIEGD